MHAAAASPVASVRARGFPRRSGLARTLLVCSLVVVACGVWACGARAATSGVISGFSIATSTGSEPAAFSDSTAASGFVAPSLNWLLPVPVPAGSDDNFSETMTFNYGTGVTDQTVSSLTLDLPVGMMNSLTAVPSTCSPAQLASFTTIATQTANSKGGYNYTYGSGCPAAAQIGTTTGTAQVYGAPVVLGGNLYLMPATSSADVAAIGVQIWARLGSSAVYRSLSASGPVVFAVVNGQPQLQVTLSLPASAGLYGATSAQYIPSPDVPYYLTSLQDTINGETTSGSQFVYMPSSEVSAETDVSVAVQNNGLDGTTAGAAASGVAGTASGDLVPDSASALPYAPQLAVAVTRDSADSNVALTTTITQQADESPSTDISIQFPSDLTPNLGDALGLLCSSPTYTGCSAVGTATAETPLLSSPLVGSLYLTGTPAAPVLDIVFPQPFAITIAGAVSLTGNSVEFGSVPDLPLTSLEVALDGGANGLYETNCAFGGSVGTAYSASGAVNGSFASQSGATATASGAFAISGCPVPTVTVFGPGSQSATVDTATTLYIAASDSAQETLTFAATGLPAGLSIDPATGTISGTPTATGTASVTVTATDTAGAQGSATFSIVVSAAGTGTTTTGTTTTGTTTTGTTTTSTQTGTGSRPSASAALQGLALQHARPTLKVVFTDRQTKFNVLTISAPSGVKFVKSRRLSHYIKISGAKLKSVKLSHGRLIVTLRKAASKVSVVIQAAALNVSRSLEKKFAKHRIKTLNLKVVATFANKKHVTVGAKVTLPSAARHHTKRKKK